MLKFIHLSDLHLTGSGEPHEGYDTHAATERALGHALQLFPDADFMVITGDLANWGEVAAYRRVRALLDRVPLPVFLMIGNHDNRDNFLSIFGERHPFEMPFAQYEATVGAFRLLFLDTQTAGTHGGALCRHRLDWLDGKLRAADGNVMIFMHHHPVPLGAPSLDAKGLADWPALHAVLARHRDKIRHIFHGHCHTAVQGHVEGISFTGIRSIANQAYTDLSTDQACRHNVAAHYAVVLADERSVVTHFQEFNYAGPILRRDRQQFDNFRRLCAERGVAVPFADPIVVPAE